MTLILDGKVDFLWLLEKLMQFALPAIADTFRIRWYYDLNVIDGFIADSYPKQEITNQKIQEIYVSLLHCVMKYENKSHLFEYFCVQNVSLYLFFKDIRRLLFFFLSLNWILGNYFIAGGSATRREGK